ncbi:MAG: hypothetical protein HYV63_32650 [Candidatus Schekmanbacteria bacterium]|nr:hypothetical protein [Candidatus Schekmanbacteria bacterium]
MPSGSFLRFGLGLLVGLALLFACSGSPDKSPAAAADGANQVYGHWAYASGESEGSTTHVSGDLKLHADGTFEDSRYIGGIGGFRKGTFTIEGEQLRLTFDEGGNTQTYAFTLGAASDADGKQLDTLLLDGQGLSFLLTRKGD